MTHNEWLINMSRKVIFAFDDTVLSFDHLRTQLFTVSICLDALDRWLLSSLKIGVP